MLKYVKKQIGELLETLEEARQEAITAIRDADSARLINILADVQEAAVAIGDRIEEAEGLKIGDEDAGANEHSEVQVCSRHIDANAPAAEIISILEQYCEFLWRITQERDAGRQQALIEEAWALLGNAERKLEQIPEQMAAVFMPYKASMWDSMESIWMAACADPDCVPFVVPIPYFDLKNGEITERHYEGGLLPDYVPVIHYNDFPLEELHPEAIFLHNPFDDCNTVTSVLPQFYSGELKKVADRLIYIPYFVTGEAVFRTHRYLPSYENMDFIVTQCEKTIESFSAELPREKFLPFGTPIADRVLRLEREKPEIPEEWKPQLKNGQDFGGDKVVMLNASITMMMGQRERFLDKLEYIIETAGQREGITLVWRPHPLLAATAKSMGEKYVERLAFLEDKFLREKIGVLDKTPDVGVTVALCDAYLGEISSSVVHMFGIAGKPRFYINLQIPEEVYDGRTGGAGGGDADREKSGTGNAEPDWHQDEENKKSDYYRDEENKKPVRYRSEENAGADRYRNEENTEPDWHRDEGNTEPDWYQDKGSRMAVSAMCQSGDKEYFVLDNMGWILEKDAGTDSGYMPLVRIPGWEIVRGRAYRRVEVKEGCIWLYPENAQGTFIYDIKCGRMRKIFGREENEGFGTEDRDAADKRVADWTFIEPDEKCISIIRAERFRRGNPGHVWYEGEQSRLDDYFRFLETTDREDLKGSLGAYPLWIANLDGSCGEKVLQAVKASCFQVGRES